MRYRCVRDCYDFSGVYYHKGEVVELLEGRHSKYLVPELKTCECEAVPAPEPEPEDAQDKSACEAEVAAIKEETAPVVVKKRTRKKTAGA